MKRGRGLIIFPGALGDLICLLPAIHSLSQRYPALGFDLMAREELARFAERRMGIVAGHSIDRPEVALLFIEEGGASSQARNFFGQFDRIECFFAANNPTFCTSLLRACGTEISFYPFRSPGEGHISECYLRLVGASPTNPPCDRIGIMPEDFRDARHRLDKLGLQPGRFLLVFPGSGSVEKNWPAENFARLTELAGKLLGVLVVLGPAEKDLAPIFAGPSQALINEIELGELAAVASMARCFIGNDSGVSHLAAASGAVGLVFFGPTNPRRWRPLGNVKVLQQHQLRSLSADTVWPCVAELIADDS